VVVVEEQVETEEKLEDVDAQRRHYFNGSSFGLHCASSCAAVLLLVI
jgi:hypothetical protein